MGNLVLMSNNTIEIFRYCDLLAMRYYLSIIYNNSLLMTFNVIIGGILVAEMDSKDC